MTEFQDIEALWTALFTVDGKKVNAGVVVFETNCVFSGDSWYFYTGSYQAKDGKLTARPKSTHYAGPMGSPSIGARPVSVTGLNVSRTPTQKVS